MKLQVKGLFAAACVLSTAVFAAEETNTWFTVNVQDYADKAAMKNLANWSDAGDSAIATENNVKYVDVNTDEGLLAYTPASASAAGNKALIKLRVKFSAAESLEDLGTFNGAQAAISILNDGVTNSYVGLANGQWVALTNSAVADPSDANYTDIAVAMDYCADPQTVTYFVKSGNEYKALGLWPDGATTKLALSSGESNRVSSVAFSGVGAVTDDFAGNNITKPYEFTVSGGPTELKVDYTWAADKIANFATLPVAQRTAALSADGANGMPVWQSFVLGLDSADANSQLVVDGEQTADAGTLRIKVATPAADAGVTVKYQLQKKNGANWDNVGEASNNNYFDIDLSNGPTGSYRIQAVIE